MPKGTPLTDEFTAQMRRKISGAAAELIYKQGFQETSLSQIARQAGIGKSTIYDYFQNKDQIILTLLEEPLAEVRSKAEVIGSGPGSIPEKLGAILDMHLKVLLRDKALIFKLFFESQRLDLETQAQHEIKRRDYQELLINLVEEGIREGDFREIDPDIMVKTMLSILSSVVMTPHPSGTPEEMLEIALDLLLRGALNKENN